MACMLTWDTLHIRDIIFLLEKAWPGSSYSNGKRSGVSFTPNMIDLVPYKSLVSGTSPDMFLSQMVVI